MIEAGRRSAHTALAMSLLALGACAQGAAEIPPDTQAEVIRDASAPSGYPRDTGVEPADDEDAGVSEDGARVDAADDLDSGVKPSLDAGAHDGAQHAEDAVSDVTQADAELADAMTQDGAQDGAAPYSCPGCVLKVQWNTSTTAASSQSIAGYLKLINTGSAPIALSGVTVRYWLRDAQAEGLVVECYYWDDGTGGNKCQRANDAGVNMYSDLNARVGMGADSLRYLELSFPASAGELAPGGATPGALQLAFHLPNYAPMDQSDDPSFDATLSGANTSTLFDAPKISAYVAGTLAWGLEP